MRDTFVALNLLTYTGSNDEFLRLERALVMSLQGRKSSQVQVAPPGNASNTDSTGQGSVSDKQAANSRIQNLIGSAPARGTLALILGGMIVGMITSYVILPTEFTGASPRHMSRQAIQQWVRMVAVGHSEDVHYDDANALLVLQQIPKPQDVVEGLADNTGIPAAERAALEALTDINGYSNLTGALAPEDPGIVSSALQVVLALAVVAAGVTLLVIAGRTVYPARNDANALRRERRSPGTQAQTSPEPAAAPATVSAHSEAPAAATPWVDDETEKSGRLHPQYGVPVLHTVSTYVKGRNYDDSFAIELGPDQGNQFLGECGISIATRVGNELQSVEFWGFDMASQETMTKVFAAPAALSDPALQAAVANRVKDPTVDIVAAEAGARLLVESQAIQIHAEIKSVICNYGGGTPNSGIETLQIELMAWYKQSQGAAVSAGGYPASTGSPFDQYADIELTPPSQTTSPTPPPAPSSTPQPAKRPEDEEEDPFGGTGNFMPYS